MSPTEKLARELRRELDRLDGQTLASISRSFDREVYKSLRGDIDALTKMLEAEKSSVNIRNTTEYKRLIADARENLKKWQSFMSMNVPSVAGQGIDFGIDHAAALVESYKITGAFRRMNPQAIEKLLGYLQEGSELYKRIGMMTDYHAGLVADAIVGGVSSGKSPRVIADLITKHLGMALTDSLRTTRTVQIWSYREANRASYIANSDVVEGWIWYATLDSECCMSCIAQHGTFHDNSETLDDHYNGHCSMIPKVIKADPDLQTGADWFSKLSDSEQREHMGADKYEAWKDDKFSFSDLSKQGHDDVYGTMRTEASLSELLGE